jgi:hypothetical protein
MMAHPPMRDIACNFELPILASSSRTCERIDRANVFRWYWGRCRDSRSMRGATSSAHPRHTI